MAATSAVTARIDRAVHSLLAEVEDLPRLAVEWSQLADGERASIALDWDHLMGSYLTELDRVYRSRQMTTEQQARYQTLLCKLRDALPLLERLDLFLPPVPLEI